MLLLVVELFILTAWVAYVWGPDVHRSWAQRRKRRRRLGGAGLGPPFLSPSNGPLDEIRILTSSRWSLRNHRLARVLDEGQPTVPRPLEITGWRERDALRHHYASATSGAATVEDSRSHLR